MDCTGCALIGRMRNGGLLEALFVINLTCKCDRDIIDYEQKEMINRNHNGGHFNKSSLGIRTGPNSYNLNRHLRYFDTFINIFCSKRNIVTCVLDLNGNEQDIFGNIFNCNLNGQGTLCCGKGCVVPTVMKVDKTEGTVRKKSRCC